MALESLSLYAKSYTSVNFLINFDYDEWILSLVWKNIELMSLYKYSTLCIIFIDKIDKEYYEYA